MSARVLQRSYLSDGSLLGLALSWNPGSGGGRLTTWMLTAKYAPQMTPDEAQTSLISDNKDTEVAMDVFAASDYGVLVVLPFLGGVLTHQGLFRRYQLDRYPLTVASAFVFLQFALFKALQLPYGADASSRYSVAIVTFASFFSGLCLSTIVHRTVFHPLKKFPGPFPARLSKFWGVYKTAGTRIKWYKFSRDLHAKYGDYVRIGPRELSITDPEAIVPVLGPGSRTSKGPFYGSLEQSVHTTLDKEFHRQRRRVWDNAFKVTLTDFAPSVEAGTDDLISVITPTIASGAPVLINDLCQRYSFDIMCSLAFGKSGGYLLGQTGARDEAIFKIIHDSLDVIALVVHTPWVIKILENCSKIPGPMKSLNDWSAEKVEMRKKMKDPQPDLMGYLMKHTKDDAEGRTLLNAESRLIIGAGTDTTAGALTMIFAYLANHPSHAALLRAEIDAAFATDTYSCFRPLPILDATINEVLRLHPPVTWGSSRVTPADGLQIGQTYIPPNVIVSLPPCGITRDPRNFDDPNSFRPERWTTSPELIRNRAAFIPFLLGPYQCPGKGLAMMELRSVTARAVARFEVVWMEEATLAEWIEGIKDHFTMGCPALRVGFKEVGRGEEQG